MRVLGNGSIAQGTLNSSNQGWFVMRQNSVVEYAFSGASSTPTVTGYTGNKHRGVIQTTSSSFRNNRTDIEINDVIATNPNISRFTTTTFITDAPFNLNYWPGVNHVHLTSVRDIRFLGCYFANLNAQNYPLVSRGTGIFATNALFIVQEFCNVFGCTNFVRSTFEDLRRGVYATSSNGWLSAKIDRSEFINTNQGIFLGGMTSAVVTRNNFTVNRETGLFTPTSYGLYLNGCTGYQVDENDFTDFDNPSLPAPALTYGIVVNNSGEADNIIYKNSFHNIQIGGQSQRKNAVIYDENDPNLNNLLITGLEWRCNHFFDDLYKADLAVTSGVIDYEQGALLNPNSLNAAKSLAGNRFSHSTFDSQNDIAVNNVVPGFVYYHHADAITTPLAFNSLKVTPTVNNLNYSVGHCPTRIKSGKLDDDLIIVRQQISDVEAQTDQLKAKLDGGDTDGLLSVIASTMASGQKKDKLLNASPYLGDAVLIAYILCNPPSGHLKQVLLANSTLSSNVLAVLATRNLPPGIKNQIHNAQTGVSEHTYLNNEIHHLEKERWFLVDELIRLYLFDSTETNKLEEIMTILTGESSFERRRQQLELLVMQGESVEAEALKDSLKSICPTCNFIELVEIHLEATAGQSYCYKVRTDNQTRSRAEAIANDPLDQVTCVKAEALLAMAFGTIVDETIEQLLPIGNGRMSQPLPELQELSTQHPDFTVHPNPATNTLFAELNDDENALWQIIDAQGRTVLSGSNSSAHFNLDITPLPSGIYHLLIQTENKTMQQRFVVRK